MRQGEIKRVKKINKYIIVSFNPMQYFNAYSYNYRVRFSHQHTRTFRGIKRPGTGRRDEQGCLGQKHNQSNIIPVT